jgi:hypothetical protein
MSTTYPGKNAIESRRRETPSQVLQEEKNA